MIESKFQNEKLKESARKFQKQQNIDETLNNSTSQIDYVQNYG
jgi:hypothetical protein